MLDFEMNPIITKINNKEKNGFITFFNQTFQYMYARAKYLFPNNVECKHFLIATYQNIYQNINTYSSAESTEHWLSLAILETYDQILKENNIKAFEQISDPKTSSLLALKSSLGSSPQEKEVSIPILANIIHQMPALPKIISLSFYYDGLQTAQIADIFDCPEIYVSWEIGKTKDYLLAKYKEYESTHAISLFPFSLPLIYSSFDFLNEDHSVTKEFAAIVWEDISKNFTFKKHKRKKSITLPVLLIFSFLILAFIFIRMMGDNTLFSNDHIKPEIKNNQNNSNILEQSSESNTQDSIPKPKTTVTIKNADGSVKVYDEKNSEVTPEITPKTSENNSDPSQKTTSLDNTSQTNTTNNNSSNTTDNPDSTNNNSSNTTDNPDNTNNNSSNTTDNPDNTNNNSSNTTDNPDNTNNNPNSTITNKNAASDSSKAATDSNHTITAPSVPTPSVHTPTVNTPSVTAPSVTAPQAPTP